MRCLRDAAPEMLGRIVPVLPAEGDWHAWLALAADIQALHETLSADGVSFDEVLVKCQGVFDFDDQQRWEVLAELQQSYEAVLQRQGLCDRHAVLRDASPAPRHDLGADIVLIATADLPIAIRRLMASFPSRAFALIHAPDSLAEGFDEVGCLIPAYWVKRHLPLDPAQVRIVDRPRDQAHEVLDQIVQLTSMAAPSATADDQPLEPGQITVGLGDPNLAPLIERTLELGAVPARPAAGRRVARTRPGFFLEAWCQYLRQRRFDGLAALLRHPDVEKFLWQTLGPDSIGAVDGWLTLLDQYLTEHVQGRVSKGWLGKPEISAPLEAVRQAIDNLAPEHAAKSRPLPEWSAVISAALTQLYGQESPEQAIPDDARPAAALEVIKQILADQAGLDPQDPATPQLNLADAITLTLSRLREAVLPRPSNRSNGPAIELLGWLELQLDDAPALILTSVNEGYIPESINHDAFLPDSVRRKLGMLDNRRRYARDLMALTAILKSRPRVRLISGRRSTQDDPLMPSRLLLACPEDELPARVCDFYDRLPQTPVAPVLHSGSESLFRLPLPVPPAQPIQGLEVTAFRDYLACPYRFYLKHVRGLDALDDTAVEMTPSTFGSLAHHVLDDYGRSHLAQSTDSAEIAAYLEQKLESLCRRSFGSEPPAAITLQREQLRQRLEVFAAWQARQVREGWRVLGLTEKRLRATLDVDGLPFQLTGRIDRIDQHPEKGLRILDYKTGDAGKDPDETHRAGSAWMDLQLPLYRLLARSAGLSGPIQLGYVRLPKKLGDVGLAAAECRGGNVGECGGRSPAHHSRDPAEYILAAGPAAALQRRVRSPVPG